MELIELDQVPLDDLQVVRLRGDIDLASGGEVRPHDRGNQGMPGPSAGMRASCRTRPRLKRAPPRGATGRECAFSGTPCRTRPDRIGLM